MLKQWVGCAAENVLAGRRTFRPEAIVIHSLASIAEADRRFADPASAESVHYAVSEDGVVHQYVEEADTAFHAGIVVNASWKGLKTGQNPNFYTIGIAGASGTVPWTGAMYDALALLVNEVAARWSIAVDADHIVLHDEIRASKDCPGTACDRAVLLARVSRAGVPPGIVLSRTVVRLIQRANLRDGAPSTRVRIAATLGAGTDVEVTGFTDTGERIQGNPIWYQTPQNHFVWAGTTDAPQPVTSPVVPSPASSPSLPPAAASSLSCGIPAIDGLFSGQSATVISRTETNRAAVGAVQDLLACQGYAMPGLLSPAYGRFGNQTATAVLNFRSKQNLPTTDVVDTDTLRRLVTAPAPEPRITRAYMTLALGIEYRGMQKVVSIVAQMEGVGKFGALNLNTDKAGLSYGLIQWAQKPKRLAELLRAFSTLHRDQFVAVFGDGDASLADSLIAFTMRPNGGVDPATGVTTDPRFNLVAEPWVSRFRQATMVPEFQRAQIDAALRAFTASYQKIQTLAPDVRSERGAAFMLDVANQFGDGGLGRIYKLVRRAGMTEMDVLEAIADQTVSEMPDRFQRGVRDRRDGFLFTTVLSDEAADLFA